MTDYKLVPVEPTPEQIEPFARQWCISNGIDPDEPQPPHGEYPRWYGEAGPFAEMWKAISASMLSAAPEPVSDPAAPVVGEPVAWTEDMERARREDDYERGFHDGRKSDPKLAGAVKALEAVATEAHNLPLNWPTDPEARLLWEALNRATFFADEALAQIKGCA